MPRSDLAGVTERINVGSALNAALSRGIKVVRGK
jgi:hypothetical protein